MTFVDLYQQQPSGHQAKNQGIKKTAIISLHYGYESYFSVSPRHWIFLVHFPITFWFSLFSVLFSVQQVSTAQKNKVCHPVQLYISDKHKIWQIWRINLPAINYSGNKMDRSSAFFEDAFNNPRATNCENVTSFYLLLLACHLIILVSTVYWYATLGPYWDSKMRQILN